MSEPEIECEYVALQSDAWETSVDAYEALLPALKKVRGQVAEMIHKYTDVPLWNGLVDKEIEDLCTKAYGPRGARTYAIRRIELVSMGLVKWTGETRHPKTVAHEDTQAMNVWRIATPEEIRQAMLDANCSSIGEYLEAVAPQNVTRGPRVQDIIATWRSNEVFGDEAAARAILALFKNKKGRS